MRILALTLMCGLWMLCGAASGQIIGNYTANKIIGGTKPTTCNYGPPPDVWMDTATSPPTLNTCGSDGAYHAISGGGGLGTVTVVGSGNLNFGKLVSGGGSTTLQTPSNSATLDSSGNVAVNDLTVNGTCTGCGGGGAFSSLTGGTNTAAAMVVGTGASLSTSGSGTVAATSAPLSGISGLGTGVGTFLGTPSSANLAAAITDETGSGAAVFGTTPTLTTPRVTTINDANGNAFIASTATASAVDSITVTNAATANPATVKIGATGSDTNINLELDPKGSGTVQMGASGGVGGGFTCPEGTAASASAGNEVVYCDSTDHQMKIALNNGSYVNVLSSAGLAAIASGKTLTVSNTMTQTATDSSTVAFGAGGTVTYTIASGAKALATGAISSATCTSVQTDTATGTATTDAIIATFNGDPTAVTGYVPLTTGMLTIIAYPTSNTVNFKVCNNTSSSITPGAITLNWRVVR